jgi:hypothetical protein
MHHFHLVNLYGDDGIAIYLNNDGDICDRSEAYVRVIGHRLYCCSAEQAADKIRDAYLARPRERN